MKIGKLAGIPCTALVLLGSLAMATPAFSQATTTPPATSAAPDSSTTATPPAGADQTAPAPGAINPDTGLPEEAQPPAEQAPGAIQQTQPAPEQENPYGLTAMFKKGDPVTWTVGIVLAIMSGGSWLIFIAKFLSSGSLLGQGRQVQRLWSAGSLEEGISRLDRRSVYRSLAEDAQAASHQASQMAGITASDWIGTALNQSIENISSQLRGGNSFLATVASAAPFVGLFGTVYGVLKALLSIGISGQPSIDKVAGPVGEALIMTAIGLFAAVPAVIFYNVVIGRNRQVIDSLRNFATDIQAALLGASPKSGEVSPGRRR